MKAPKFSLLLTIAATVAVGAAIGLTLRSAYALPTQRRHIEQKTASLEKLRDLQQSLGADRAARQAFETLSPSRATDLKQLTAGTLPGAQSEVRPRERVPLADGWSRAQVDVTFSQIALPDVMRFVDSAARERPPWRLVECNMVAAGRAGHADRITLTMEAVERR